MSRAEDLRRDVEAMRQSRLKLEAASEFALAAEAVGVRAPDTRITITLRPDGRGKVVVNTNDASAGVLLADVDPSNGLAPALDSLLGALVLALAAVGRRFEAEARDEWAARLERDDDPA